MEPHDACTLPGCTLGRAHVGEHLGPRCPVCGVPSRRSSTAEMWLCRTRDCAQVAEIPAPAELARQVSLLAALAEGAPAGFYGVSREQPAPPSDVDQLLLDLQALASEEDERARGAQRRAADLRAMIREINAWRAKTSPSSPVATNDRRGIQP